MYENLFSFVHSRVRGVISQGWKRLPRWIYIGKVNLLLNWAACPGTWFSFVNLWKSQANNSIKSKHAGSDLFLHVNFLYVKTSTENPTYSFLTFADSLPVCLPPEPWRFLSLWYCFNSLLFSSSNMLFSSNKTLTYIDQIYF